MSDTYHNNHKQRGFAFKNINLNESWIYEAFVETTDGHTYIDKGENRATLKFNDFEASHKLRQQYIYDSLGITADQCDNLPSCSAPMNDVRDQFLTVRDKTKDFHNNKVHNGDIS